VAAIHGLLRRNRAGAAEIAEEIKSAEDRARHLKGVLNDWVDRVHHSAYQEAAHSMAAVGMLAPFVETVLHQCFLGIGNRLYPIASQTKSHDRWKAAHALEWDCHYFISGRGVKKDLAKGIDQLASALGLTSSLPADFGKTTSALIAYRNAMFHNGLEWPIKERQKFERRIGKEWPSEWFTIGRSGENPWIFYMSETFIQHVLSSIEQMLKVLGQFVADNWPKGQTF
jgi:hypothetical protein